MPTTCDGSGAMASEWSARTRRGVCPVCGRQRVALKRDGTLWPHTPAGNPP